MISLPSAAATETAGALADLAIVLVAAKLGDELFKRLKQPALVGEILAGVAIGPSVLGFVEPSEALEIFAERRASLFKTFLTMPKGTPSADTFRRVFEALDPKAFQDAFRRWR